MGIYMLAFLIGVVAGLRAMTAPAAVSWGAALGWLHLKGTWLAFMGFKFTPYIFTLLAIVELVSDQLPKTPSRKVPQQFGARVLRGALCGAAIGAVVGTLGGYEFRSRLARAAGSDLPIALLEDAIAIGAGIWIAASVV